MGGRTHRNGNRREPAPAPTSAPASPAAPEVTPELAAEHGLSADEYARVVAALGRAPTLTELGVVSVMWSEHCSYKSSRVHLKQLPTAGPRVILGPGENAGVVDVGDGQAVVFKMESHNHPSFIEPYQGAATGVGGICRDVFTMGARPIALADCLRFGRPDHPRTSYLVGGVVAGIGGYGNSFGVPTVAGDVAFHDSYDGNILVNAFCLGLARADRIFLGRAAGVGNPVIYVGAKTGRDGIHGATMASAEFADDAGDDAQAKRPAVQVGDPFMEKLLLEACLELMQRDVLVGIQDMGAAGLTSSSVEMAARAGSGIELDLERVPQRERGMTPYEIMLSESQERMLLVAERGREDEVFAIFDKWDLAASVIGRVTDTGRVVVRMHGETFADLPAALLADGAIYDRPRARPAYLDHTERFDPSEVSDLRTLPRSPTVASGGHAVADAQASGAATPAPVPERDLAATHSGDRTSAGRATSSPVPERDLAATHSDDRTSAGRATSSPVPERDLAATHSDDRTSAGRATSSPVLEREFHFSTARDRPAEAFHEVSARRPPKNAERVGTGEGGAASPTRNGAERGGVGTDGAADADGAADSTARIDPADALAALLAHPDVASKEWVWRQYDHQVRHATVISPGAADAGVVRVFADPATNDDDRGHDSEQAPRQKGVAVTAGCTSRHVYLAPYEGTRLVVAEAYANLCAVGAEPIAVTNCLNFGNPEKPEIMWQLAESVRGLGDACRALDTPVVSGNVSLYNETDGRAIRPTPMVAMVGLLEDVTAHATMAFAAPGHAVCVLGDVGGDIAGSLYLEHIHGRTAGVPAPLDVARHRPVFDAMRALVRERLVVSAHDVSDGGLAVCVAECCIAGGLGAALALPSGTDTARLDALLFGEAPARFVISCERAALPDLKRVAGSHGAPVRVVGETGGDRLVIRADDVPVVDLSVSALRDPWATGFTRALA